MADDDDYHGQTAPESSYLFDPPPTTAKKPGTAKDKRRSTQGLTSSSSSSSRGESSQPKSRQQVRHQRSQSATPEMFSGVNRRGNNNNGLALGALVEEDKDSNVGMAASSAAFSSAPVVPEEDTRKKQNPNRRQSRTITGPRPQDIPGIGPLPAMTISASAASGNSNNKSEAMVSLQDIISTLKNLPPISVKKQDNFSADPSASTSSSSTGQGRRAGHRKQQSMSSISFSRSSGGQNSDLGAIAEDRTLDARKDGKRQSYGGNNGGADRMSSSSSTSSSKDKRTSRPPTSSAIVEEEEGGSKANARAEAEAKLMGTYKEGDGETVRSDRRRSTIEEIAKVNENRRRSMATNTVAGSVALPPLPLSAEGLEQGSAQTLAQKSNKRLSFNKPLNLSTESKASTSTDTSHQHPQPQQSHSQPHQGSGSNKPHQQRRSSRGSYDGDWRAPSSGPLSPHAPPFSPRTKQFSLSLIPLTPARTNFPRDDANPNARRPLFTAHLPFSALTPLVKSRQLIRGTLRINKRNRSDAYVTSDLDGDIYICGSRDRNRALEGDVVAVKLVDVDKVLREKKEKEEAKLMRNGGVQRPRAVEEEDTEIVLGGDEDVEKVRPKYCGVIVAVLERQQGQLYSGQLTLLRPNNKRAMEEKEAEEKARQQGSAPEKKAEAPRIVWFKPTDKRVPLIAIPIEQVPDGFVERHETYEHRLFVGSIKRWPITSLHPFGTLERELGDVGDLGIESQAVLADYNVNTSEFPEAALKCIPSTPWSEKEFSSRRDMRTWRIFTIDPPNSSDLDDALSITHMEDGTTEVGVHIADVSYFIKSNTPLDKEARNRSTSVYLVDQSVPMLPPALNEICSLEPNVDKLAFSVVWRMSPDAKIMDTWYGRTIINSCARLTYDNAQAVIDSGSLPSTVAVYNQSVLDIEGDLLSLHDLATKLSNARLQNGSLSLDRSKLKFTLDPNTKHPTDVSVHKFGEAESLVREFMLLSNMSVAQKISSGFPEQALLRRRDKPVERRINEFIKHTEKLGIKFDGSSSGKLQASLNSIHDEDTRLVLNLLSTKPMQRAKYFCTGTTDIAKYQHYSLNVPLYTHFTSPICRYADIIVHRQLEATLAGEKRFYLDKDTVQKTAQYCNIKKDGSMSAQEASSALYLCSYLHSLSTKSTPIIRDAVVVAIHDQAFDILVPEYGIEKRIHMDSLPLEGYKYSETRGSIRLYWKKGVQSQEASNLMEYNPHADDESDDESVVDEDAIFAAMQEKGDNQEPGHISELATVQEVESEEAEMNASAAAAIAVAIVSSSLESNGAFHHSVASSSTPWPSTSYTLPSARRASVAHSYNTNRRASTAQGVHDEENFSQTLKIFSQLNVCITVSVDQSPPSLKVLAVNPFM